MAIREHLCSFAPHEHHYEKAASTRLTILQKAFELIYANGYQATSVDQIIAGTSVTKGAFYYHFKNKDEMGVAIINELLRPLLTSDFLLVLTEKKNPLEGIYDFMYSLLIKNDKLTLEHGCPVGNLSQEMTPWNNEFRKVLDDLAKQWRQALVDVLERGKAAGYVRPEVNPEQVAFFVISGYWGIRSFGKLANDREVYRNYLNELKGYLASLT